MVHITTVHSSGDVRIYEKECRSLAEAGWRVTLLAPLPNSSSRYAIHVVGVRVPKNRLWRAVVGNLRAYHAAVHRPADIYHIHDPELLVAGFALGLGGRVVIYDVHEDVQASVDYKEYIPRWLRPLIGRVVRMIEQLLASQCAALVAATPSIAKAVRRNTQKVVVIQNFPRPEQFQPEQVPAYIDRDPVITYVGSISRARGALEMVEAMALVSSESTARLQLAGSLESADLLRALQQSRGSERLEILGFVGHQAVARLLGSARVGLAVLHPELNYMDSYPTKLFEYMAAGIPVVASDFPIWREIVERAGCGLLVDPLDPAAIARALDWLLRDPERAASMGEAGRQAVLARFSWKHEEEKLLGLYDALGWRAR